MNARIQEDVALRVVEALNGRFNYGPTRLAEALASEETGQAMIAALTYGRTKKNPSGF